MSQILEGVFVRLFSILILCNRKAAAFPVTRKSMLILCCITALVWGITNWFLKQGSTGLQKIHYNNRIKQFAAEIRYFFTNAQVGENRFFFNINDEVMTSI